MIEWKLPTHCPICNENLLKIVTHNGASRLNCWGHFNIVYSELSDDKINVINVMVGQEICYVYDENRLFWVSQNRFIEYVTNFSCLQSLETFLFHYEESRLFQ